MTPIARAPNPIDPGVRIAHTHLRTADIDRTRRFYVDVFGFDVIAAARDVPGWGTTGDIRRRRVRPDVDLDDLLRELN